MPDQPLVIEYTNGTKVTFDKSFKQMCDENEQLAREAWKRMQLEDPDLGDWDDIELNDKRDLERENLK